MCTDAPAEGRGSPTEVRKSADKSHLFFCFVLFSSRILIVRKKPSRQKLLSGLVVMIGLFISLIPSVLSDFSNRDQDEVDGISRVMWPIMFMFGFVSKSLIYM